MASLRCYPCWSELLVEMWSLHALCDLKTVMQLPLPLLQPLNRRGKGTSEVSRIPVITSAGQQQTVFVKRQRDFFFRDAAKGFRRQPTLLREHRNLVRLAALGITVPQVVCFQHAVTGLHHEAVLVTRELNNFTPLGQALSTAVVRDPAARAELFGCLGKTLVVLYAAGLRHGCLYPGHILVCCARRPFERGDVALIDLEKMRHVRRRTRAIAKDISQLLRRLQRLNGPEMDALLSPLEAIAPRLRDDLCKDMTRRQSRIVWGSPY